MIINDDCLTVLKDLPDNSIDSLVTDPPAGISFLGKDWDSDKGGRDGWIAWMTEVMTECLRVLKPGAHGLVWAIPRTSHWTATALENAGFEVRDVVTHLFGQGFPKSLDVSKAIDKAAGEYLPGAVLPSSRKSGPKDTGIAECFQTKTACNPQTDDAKKWQGWGTALKPASEHWILVRKPVSEKTVAANVQKWGTGAINIDASRIGYDAASFERHKKASEKPAKAHASAVWKDSNHKERMDVFNSQGRFPANLVLSHSPYCTDDQCDTECAIVALDEQSGTLQSGSRAKGVRKGVGYHGGKGDGGPAIEANSGGASRFFYCAKISTSERNAGCDKNHHPTVKPKKLMAYLIRMVTPPGGIVLDPFTGSGSTGIAAAEEGFEFLGIEKEVEYAEIARLRIENATVKQPSKETA